MLNKHALLTLILLIKGNSLEIIEIMPIFPIFIMQYINIAGHILKVFKQLYFQTSYRSRNRMSEKKATGIQKPLNVSVALAKIIGTKKGEQVILSSKSKRPKFI